MADDSLEIIQEMEFHPCLSPRGNIFYDFKVLADDQQTSLNDFKKSVIVENYTYLANHPEVRALLVLITNHVFRKCPRSNIHIAIGEYFSQPRRKIQSDINEYLKRQGEQDSEGVSAVILNPGDSVIYEPIFEDGELNAESEENKINKQCTVAYEACTTAQSSYYSFYSSMTRSSKL